MDRHYVLIGDIGGTNARFAIAGDGTPAYTDERTFQCRDFASADDAIDRYLDSVGRVRLSGICLAVAGPVVDDQVRFTNSHWHLQRAALGTRFQAGDVRLMNDFEAVAWSIPMLAAGDTIGIGPLPQRDLAQADFTIAVAGPGTGFGAAGLLRRDGRLTAVAGEGGHLGFAPESPLQTTLLRELRSRFGRVSDERIVSGPGLENVYRALRLLQGTSPAELPAAEIVERAANASDPHAVDALQLFFEVLGQAAGNLALAFGATDGVYIAGGIVRRRPDLLVNSRFRAGFENKGRYRGFMERIPTRVILHPQPGLLGAASAARQLPCSQPRDGNDPGPATNDH